MKFDELVRYFFSKVNNITESLEKGLDKVVSRGEKNFSVHRKYMNFLRPRKTALDEPLYKLSAGRSMVEMLGVLAIIGVLSVGAISGYSKAMTKYRLNKQAEAFNMLLNNSLQILHQLDHSGRLMYHAETLDKLNLIPDGIKLKDSTYLTDIFGNDIWVYSYPDFFGIGYKFAASDAGKEQCYNLAQATKDNSSELWVIEIYKYYNDENTSHTVHGEMYGDKFCNSDTQKCLRNLVISDLDALCNVCDEQDCVFYTLWK